MSRDEDENQPKSTGNADTPPVKRDPSKAPANPLVGESALAEALAQIKASTGSAATPLEAVGLARTEIIKAKVQLEDVHSKWKKLSGKLAGAILIWEALHLRAYGDSSEISRLLQKNDVLLVSHLIALLSCLLMLANQWFAKSRVKPLLKYNKHLLLLCWIIEMSLFAVNLYHNLNTGILTGNEAAAAAAANVVVAPNIHKHYPFAAGLYAVLYGQDLYMYRQQMQSYKRFITVDALYKSLRQASGTSASGTPSEGASGSSDVEDHKKRV